MNPIQFSSRMNQLINNANFKQMPRPLQGKIDNFVKDPHFFQKAQVMREKIDNFIGNMKDPGLLKYRIDLSSHFKDKSVQLESDQASKQEFVDGPEPIFKPLINEFYYDALNEFNAGVNRIHQESMRLFSENKEKALQFGAVLGMGLGIKGAEKFLGKEINQEQAEHIKKNVFEELEKIYDRQQVAEMAIDCTENPTDQCKLKLLNEVEKLKQKEKAVKMAAECSENPNEYCHDNVQNEFKKLKQ